MAASPSVEARAAPAAPPAARVLELLIDYACAARCPFCYNPPPTPALLARRLSLRDAAGLLYARRREGYDGAWFTGGEPTQRPDLARMLRAARRLGYRRVQIGTNGWRTADLAYARALARAGLNYARVSIHAAGARAHDRLLGEAGAFARATASLATLRACGVAVGINFVLCRGNLRELPAFARAVARRWRVRDVDLLFPHERGQMAARAARIGPTYREAAPWLERAFAVFRAEGFGPEDVRLLNAPPCALPRALRAHAADWARADYAGHDVAHPEGFARPLADEKAADKAPGPGCAPCRLRARCAGYEARYAARHGTAEFAPLRGRAGAGGRSA